MGFAKQANVDCQLFTFLPDDKVTVGPDWSKSLVLLHAMDKSA
jgi:hypothetical protein